MDVVSAADKDDIDCQDYGSEGGRSCSSNASWESYHTRHHTHNIWLAISLQQNYTSVAIAIPHTTRHPTYRI
ncbi:hypothetical protein G9P44_001490 [Scheffersomyces stipitis]|nr:hypothetical protein G9P44_001490 [Scheffersomyces stipitis]